MLLRFFCVVICVFMASCAEGVSEQNPVKSSSGPLAYRPKASEMSWSIANKVANGDKTVAAEDYYVNTSVTISGYDSSQKGIPFEKFTRGTFYGFVPKKNEASADEIKRYDLHFKNHNFTPLLKLTKEEAKNVIATKRKLACTLIFNALVLKKGHKDTLLGKLKEIQFFKDSKKSTRPFYVLNFLKEK